MDQAQTIKFNEMGKNYNFILSFDEPKIFDGKYGESVCYGATLSGDNVRFYASAGLHQEIKSQGLTKGDKCVVCKVGGDFTYFTVNGVNSKHAPGKPGTSSSPAEDKPVEIKIEDITPKSIMSVDALHDKILDLEKKVTALEEAMENADNDAEVPF